MRVLSGYRHDVQLYPRRLGTAVNWGLIGAFMFCLVFWGGLASWLWGL